MSGGMNRQGMLGKTRSRRNIARHFVRQLELLVRRGRQQGNHGAVIARREPTGSPYGARLDRRTIPSFGPMPQNNCQEAILALNAYLVERHRHQPVQFLSVPYKRKFFGLTYASFSASDT
jgi:hypothetical protein